MLVFNFIVTLRLEIKCCHIYLIIATKSKVSDNSTREFPNKGQGTYTQDYLQKETSYMWKENQKIQPSYTDLLAFTVQLCKHITDRWTVIGFLSHCNFSSPSSRPDYRGRTRNHMCFCPRNKAWLW